MNVTVAILTYNNNDELRRCVFSIIEGVELPPSEILVVDNSENGSAISVVEEFSKFKIRCIRSPKNNLGYARGMAVENAQYEMIAFLDSDCVAPKNWLGDLANAFNGNPKIGAVGSGNCPPGGSPFRDSLALMRKVYWGHLRSTQQRMFPTVCQVDHLPTTNVLYSKKAVLEVGNFSSENARVGEDLDLSFRLKRRGYDLIYVPNAIVDHYEKEKLLAWVSRVFRFGQAQIDLLFKYRKSSLINQRIVIPIVFLMCVLSSLLFQHPVSTIFFSSYFAFVFFTSMILCILNRKLECMGLLPILLVSAHFTYPVGQIFSFFKNLFSLRRVYGPY